MRKGSTIATVIGDACERVNAQYILGSSGNLALMGLTRALGAQSPDFEVRVVGVNPGATATDRVDLLMLERSQGKFGTPDRGAQILAAMDLPFRRMCAPEELADTGAFLALPCASYINGTIATVDGGYTNRNH
jgi:3-oxoacyl-[acyl-carrier protein] reductase